MSVVLFEVNELPARLLQDYTSRHPRSSLAKLTREARAFETFCEDQSELDPWISWPTLHRGVIDAQHNIHHLGQSLENADKEYPPIWRILAENGIRTGVFGSLHSSATPGNLDDYAFYVPDFFAGEAFAHPKELQAFQEFNLVMTRRSARNVDTGVPMKEAIAFGRSAFANGLTLATTGKIAKQLVEERLNPVRKIRRRAMQGMLGHDFFMHLLRSEKPQFATFYTNHVAAAMHRYWAAHFTEDYQPQNPMSADWIKTYRGELDFAMDILDDMVADLLRLSDATGATILLCSSIGQAAIQETGETKGFLTITDLSKLMDFIGVDRDDWSETHGMVPCRSAKLKPEITETVAAKLARMTVGGVTVVQSKNEVAPVSFDVIDGNSIFLYFYFETGNDPQENAVRLDNRSASLEEAGIGFFAHEDNVACSAHHISEGILYVYSNDMETKALGGGQRVSTLAVAPAILQKFGIEPKPYMNPASDLRL